MIKINLVYRLKHPFVVVIFLIAGLVFLDSCKKNNPEPSVPKVVTIVSFSPSSGLVGATVTITGTNFSTTAASNSVKFNGTAATVTAASETSLTTTVPVGAATGKITVAVGSTAATSATDFEVLAPPPPTITGFTPSSGAAGTTVTITGTHFSTTMASNIVKFHDVTATVTAASATSLTVTVPSEAITGKVSVTLGTQTATSSDDFTVLPAITSFAPHKGAVGSTVVITGTGFNTQVEINEVKFNNVNATVTLASVTSLTVVVPVNATTGKITVTVGTKTATTAADFTVVTEAVSAGGPGYDEAFAVAVDGSGNTYVAGSFQGNFIYGTTNLTAAGPEEIFLAKYNANCDLVWVKQTVGTGNARASAISVDPSGNIYMTGYFTQTIAFGSVSLVSVGTYDIFTARWNADGDVVWAKGAGGINTDSGISIKADASGNVFVTGNFFNSLTFGTTTLTSAGATDLFIVKYNAASGDITWAKNYGGASDDYGLGVAVNNAGDIFVVGAIFETTNFGATSLTSAGSSDGFVAKLNSDGNAVWAKKLGGAPGFDMAYSVGTDNSGDCYVSGYFTESAIIGATTLTATGNQDIFVAKYDHTTGDATWAVSAGGPDYDQVLSIAVDATGNSYVTGYFSRIASFGNTSLSSVVNSRDVFVAKFNNAGTLQWAQKGGGNGDDFGNSIAVDGSGTVYTTGSFYSSAIFGSTSFADAANSEIYLWKIWQ